MTVVKFGILYRTMGSVIWNKLKQANIFLTAALCSLAISPLIDMAWRLFFPSSGSFLDLSNNIFFSVLFGLLLSIPLSFGFWGALRIKNYVKLFLFILGPTLLIDLLWSMGNMSDFVSFFILSSALAIAGLVLGLIIRHRQKPVSS